eukprot:1789150-Amphidinium_carterae.1
MGLRERVPLVTRSCGHRQTTSPLQRWALQALPSNGTWTQRKMYRKPRDWQHTRPVSFVDSGHPSATQWHGAFDCQ